MRQTNLPAAGHPRHKEAVIVTFKTARDRIRFDADVLKWTRLPEHGPNTEFFLRGNRAIEVDFRRDGTVNSALYYSDYRSRSATDRTLGKRKKETVLAWLAE